MLHSKFIFKNEKVKFYDHFLRTGHEYKILAGYGWSELFEIKEIIKNHFFTLNTIRLLLD